MSTLNVLLQMIQSREIAITKRTEMHLHIRMLLVYVSVQVDCCWVDLGTVQTFIAHTQVIHFCVVFGSFPAGELLPTHFAIKVVCIQGFFDVTQSVKLHILDPTELVSTFLACQGEFVVNFSSM